MRALWRYLAPVSLLILCASFASAQNSADVGIGFGTAHVKANASGIDDQSFSACTPGSTSTCQSLPALSGLFMGFSGDLMLTKRYGIGGEVNFQPTRTDYGPLQSRELFYDFNGIYQPFSEKRYALQIQGGIGGARTSFIYPSTSCVGSAVCTNSNIPVGNTSHFQVHVGVGVSFYVKEHLFIRPQFDFHYVPGLDNQFGSNLVPEGTVWVGYAFGSRD